MGKTYLADGATIKHKNMSLVPTIGWDGGISKMCFRKKVFNSDNCQKTTIWHKAKNLMYVQFGSSHRTCVQLPGVNWSMTRFNFPLVERISLTLTHLYSRISRHLQIFNPSQMPSPLQSKMSRTMASHQHSTKFGNKWAKAIWKKRGENH